MYSEKEILDLIGNGENSTVEFKSADVRADGIAKEMVAFANTHGGMIFIGVDDSGKVERLADEKNYEEWIADIARNAVIPALEVKCYYCDIEGRRIIIADIPRGKDKPYQTSHDRYLVRIGSTNRTASQSELLRLFQSAGFFHYDANGVAQTSFADLNLTKIDKYFHRYEIDFINESGQDKINLLENVDILTEEGEVTVAGLLIFGINPQRNLHDASISFAHFNGNEVAEDLIHKQNVDGNIDYQVDTTLSVIRNNLLNPSTIIGSQRVDQRLMYGDNVFRPLHQNLWVSLSVISLKTF